MKALVLCLATFSSLAFADSASNFVQDSLTQGQQILSLKSTSARNEQLCTLVARVIDAKYIGSALLGQYDGLSTDKTGVDLFYKEMPSMAVTEIVKKIGDASGSSVTVSSDSTDRGDGTYSVDVTLTTSDGSSYDASIILDIIGKEFHLIDGTYFGVSGINYMAGQVQKQIGQSSDQTHPVSEYMKSQMADASYIECN